MNKSSNYTKLDQSTPLFTVTPGKSCRMYPYIWSKECAENKKPNPYLCKPQNPVDPNQKYLGYPVFFEYDLAGSNRKSPPTYSPKPL